MMNRSRSAILGVLVAAVLTACGGSGSSPTAPSTPSMPSVNGHYNVIFTDTLTRLYDGAQAVFQCGGFVDLSGSQTFTGSFAITHGAGCTPASGSVTNGRQQAGGAVTFNTDMGNQTDVTLEMLAAMGCVLTSSSQGFSGTIVGGHLAVSASGTIQCAVDGTIRLDSRIEGSR